MPQVKVYLTDEDKAVFEAYADADERSLSNFLRKSAIEKIKRDKKTGKDGIVIRPAGYNA